MNLWTGMGRLTRDPQTRSYGENNDKKMARFTLAVDRRGKREDGQQTADFIGCICYGRLADFVDQYLRQGTKVVVIGEVRTGQYENKDGQKVYTTDIIANSIEFAESKRSVGQGGQASTAPASAAPDPTQATATPEFMKIPEGAEEDLPW